MATVKLTDKNFEAEVIKAQQPVLVDFYADWCGPCKLAEPVLEQLSQDYKDQAIIAKINVDDHSQIAARYQVMSIPTTILFKQGKEIGRQIGFGGRPPYEDLIKKSL